MSVALDSRLGRPLALQYALIELRHAELREDLAAYETSLAAIPDIAGFQADDSVFEAITGVGWTGGRRRASRVGPWMPDADPRWKVLHITDYIAATFSRVVSSDLATKRADDFDRYIRDRFPSARSRCLARLLASVIG